MTTVLPDAGQRGRTTIDDRVVAKLASQVVTEVDGVVGDGAATTADIRGGTVALDVRLSIVYPASIARTCSAARARLIDRVREFTGMTVSRVDITVAALEATTTATGRVR